MACECDIFVSGRLALFGEHSDWAGEFSASNPDVLPGRCLVVGTQEGVHARARRLPNEQVLRISTVDANGQRLGPKELPLDPAALLAEAQAGGFWSYVAGTAYRLLVQHSIGGAEIDNYRTTLPMSKGLSSSAAACVMVARAFNQLYDLHLSTRGEMELGYLGETTTPSKCGRMDQGCAYGAVPILMTFAGDILHVETAELACHLHLVLVDLRATKSTTAILTALQSAYPTPSNAQEKSLHALLGAINHSITSRAVDAMRRGDTAALGQLMLEAQREFDARAGPMCPEQLTAPVLHRVLAHPPLQEHIWGCKGVGSQGDGTAQFLCRSAAAQQQVCSILGEQLGLLCMPLTVAPTSGSQPTSLDLEQLHPPQSAQDAAQQVQQCEQLVRLREAELEQAREQLQLAQQALRRLQVGAADVQAKALS